MKLTEILFAGTSLLDTQAPTPQQNLKAILIARLLEFYTRCGDEGKKIDASLEQVQSETAQNALWVVEKVQTIMCVEEEDTSSAQPPALGTRDLAQLRTLLSIVFKWGITPLFESVVASWPTSQKQTQPVPSRSKIIDLIATPEDYKSLCDMVLRVLGLILPQGANGPISQTLITTTVLNRHVTDVLRPALGVGWLPRALSTDVVPTLDEVRPLIMRLLNILPPAQSITALGGILSDGLPLPQHVQKTCTSLLSGQLLRPEGVRGLCAAVFGEEETSGDDAPLEKLTHVARILSSAPVGSKSEDYFRAIVPRILAILSSGGLASHKRASAFAISRLLSPELPIATQACVKAVLLPLLHDPFMHITPLPAEGAPQVTSPNRALETLTILLTNTDPSPTLITTILSPIVPALFALSSQLNRTKTTDPALKESLVGILSTWGRVVVSKDCLNALWTVVNGEGGEWQVNAVGDIKRVEETEEDSRLAFLTPQDLKPLEDSGDDFDLDSNIMGLRPDPVHFVQFIKSIDRPDVSSELFVKLLEAYREAKLDSASDPMRTLLYLQLVIQMQTQLSGSNSSSNILRKPEHILTFVKHALESSAAASRSLPTTSGKKTAQTPGGMTMGDLKIVSEGEDAGSEEEDSDDEEAGPETIAPDEDMVDTSVNLLLSILEANTELSARTAPVLNEIFSLLEPLVNDTSNAARPIAREAQMVLTTRLASTSAAPSSANLQNAEEEDVQETYQKALKLLQDPILPVRAHGLLLLRQLVSPRATPLDAALIPAILSILMQAVQDDDSYMFLNAVQGLAGMVDMFGREVLRRLVSAYSEGLTGGNSLTQLEVDTRSRIGEALGQIIRRCGSALDIHVNLLVPPLFKIIRSSHVPTVLRTSALSLLGECESTSAPSLRAYTHDLAEAMVDLLQVERDTQKADDAAGAPSIDAKPTSTNSKFPAFRRAAIHFLTILIRSSISRVYESGSSDVDFNVRRTNITLGYVASTDDDEVVRVMAREALEELQQLENAFIGA